MASGPSERQPPAFHIGRRRLESKPRRRRFHLRAPLAPVRSPVLNPAVSDFALDPALAASSLAVASLPLCDVRLIDDARFPWLLLVPRRSDAVEIVDLAKADRALLFEEITAASAALRAATGCEKLNVGALGNHVRQLHVHVVARFAADVAWPEPVWGSGAAEPYATADRERLIAALRRQLR